MLLPNETILKAISWTLLHSLWQGLILAIFAGLVILFTKKAKANLRYSILSGLFLAFMIAVGFTFNYEYQSDAMFISSEELIVMEDLSQEEILLPASEASDYFQMGIDFLNQNSKTIVFIWFLIFSIKCFGIFRSLSDIYRIRNYRNQEVPEYWSQRVFELSQILKIKKKIVLLESQLVSVPSVTGFFKPIILIPIGLLSNLPQDQIEAILLHELAHIRRKDYFINLIQSFAEILFFFNPGVLWVSSIIKEERENCCDDIAVGITKSKSKFIHALVSFQEYNMKQNELAMGFGSKKNQLLERAKRIIHDNNKSLNSIEKTFLSICIIIIASFTVACSNTKATASQPNNDMAFATEMEEANVTEDGLSPEEQALVDAEVAEEEALSEIEVEAEELQSDAETAQLDAEEAQREAEVAQTEAEAALAESGLSAEDIKELKNEALQAKKENELAKAEIEKARARIEISREKAQVKREELQAKRETLREDMNKRREQLYSRVAREGRDVSEQQRLESVKAKLEAQQRKLEIEKARVESQIEREKFKNGSSHTTYEKEIVTNNNGVNSKQKVVIVGDVTPPDVSDITKNIIEDLIKEKIIANTNNLSYKLSNSKLIVNDKEINTEVHKKLKKYLTPNISATYYNYDLSKDK